jgi:hypothetical protein
MSTEKFNLFSGAFDRQSSDDDLRESLELIAKRDTDMGQVARWWLIGLNNRPR